MFNMTSRRKSERRAARLGMQRGLSTPLPAWDQTLSDLPIDKQYEYMREVKGYSHEEAVREIMQRSGLSGSRIDVAVARVQDRIQRQIGNVRDTADPRSASGYSKHVVDHLVRMGVKKPEARKRVVWYRGEIVGKWLPMGVSAENAAERLRERMRVYGRGSAAAGYAVKDGNRVVARARSKVAAHRATRAKKHAGSRVVMTTRTATTTRTTTRNRAHRRTFTEARGDILQFLRSEGWQVKSDLKYPHAISRDGRTHLYFKPQAVYVGSGGGGMGNTRSMWVDIRDVDGPAFLRAVESRAA